MTTTTWGKWFWADWLADPGLRACSIGARGMWMDLLCVAATHEPPGYVAIAGRAMTIEEISRLTGVEIAVADQLVSELLAKNVCGKSTLTGALFSRRIIRDAKKAARAREIGKTGGNPNLRKQNKNTAQDNGQLKRKKRTPMELGGGQYPTRSSTETKSGNSSQDNGEPPPMARARPRSTCQKDKNLPSSGREYERPAASKINGHPQPTSGPATALPKGRAVPLVEASEASKQAKASKKAPHQLTKAEFEAQLDAKRKTGAP